MKYFTFTINGALLTMVLWVSPAAGLEQLFQVTNASDCYVAGARVHVLSDLTSDGLTEFALADSDADVGAFTDAGVVTVCDGSTGALLFRYEGDANEMFLGSTVNSVGDVDQDGVDDFAISDERDTFISSNSGRFSVYSGSSGTLIYARGSIVDNAYFGAAVAALGDVNGNGVDDFAAYGGKGGSNEGVVYLYEGSTGTVFRTLSAEDLESSFGGSNIRALGDVNGDGVIDLAVSVTGASPGGNDSAGRVDIVSGLDGTRIAYVDGLYTDGCLGSELKLLGDVSGDNISDFGATCDEMSEMLIVSGADGSILHTLDSENYGDDLFAYDIAPAGDLNDDGIQDIVVTSSRAQNAELQTTGKLYFYLGGTFTLFGTVEGTVDETLGTRIEYAGTASDGASLIFIKVEGIVTLFKLSQSDTPEPGDELFPADFTLTSTVRRRGKVELSLSFTDNWLGCEFTISAAPSRRARDENRGRELITVTGKGADASSLIRARRIPTIAKRLDRRKLYGRVVASCNDVHSVASDFEMDFSRNTREALGARRVIRALIDGLQEAD